MERKRGKNKRLIKKESRDKERVLKDVGEQHVPYKNMQIKDSLAETVKHQLGLKRL